MIRADELLSRVENRLDPLVARWRFLKLRWGRDPHTPVFVFQMGKVASSTIYRSLKEQYPGIVVHEHFFNPDFGDPWMRALYRWYNTGGDRPLKIISPVREPIGRNISAFFQNFERDTGVPYTEHDFSLEELRDLFLENYPHRMPLKFFNKIKRHFGIDVYAHSFPEEGHRVMDNGEGVELLVLRHDLEDERKAELIGSFCGISGFRLERANVGEEKIYAGTYRAFRENVRLPSSYLERMKQSAYFRHFYSEETIREVCEKWAE